MKDKVETALGADHIIERFAAENEKAGGRGLRSSADAALPRGDHDLNPELYDPAQTLRQAAVLVPLVDHDSDLTVLLTRRSSHLAHHAGQISFPGGRIEKGDRDAFAAALREAKEEIGLDADRVRLIGRLDTYVVRTGFRVHPFVGLVQAPLTLVLDRNEVEEAFEVPLSFFLRPGAKERHSRVFRGQERHFFAYPYENRYIWGATAGMLGNLAEILNPDLLD
ncbi:MAG TPA: CoA pyrophosphatase [Kiloniellaceae bacterium]|nr:CoA pyrophosphatase [Kiloniellaceae bacterium]